MIEAFGDSKSLSTNDLALRRFTVDEYHALGSAGVLGDDRVELLEGLLVMMSPINPPHAYLVGQIHEKLLASLSATLVIRAQQPVTFDSSEPQPDIAVARGKKGRYLKRHPWPRDIELVIEVADTTLRADRLKASLYGRAGIPHYWIVNVAARQLEVFCDLKSPRGKSSLEYQSRTIHKPRDQIAFMLAGDNDTLAVKDLFFTSA
ncbi:MAG TPA: Uma2 family endonuclease [Pirellulales bacterium]|jgi:Uma2 family endonuclease|nr:Uma2 family endonuclease [Pirellulales bacterium]